MGLFGKTGPERDAYKKMKKDGTDKYTRKNQKRLSKQEKKALSESAARAKITTIIDRAGKIVKPEILKNIPVYKDRLKKGKCPICGGPPERRGYVCKDCRSAALADMPTVREINNTHFSKGLGVGIPNGQNMNGTMYCINGHRVFYYAAHDAYDCAKGCNGLGPAR
jgi:hypothetical protein